MQATRGNQYELAVILAARGTSPRLLVIRTGRGSKSPLVGAKDFAAEPASSVVHTSDDPGGGADADDPGGGSTNSAEDVSALIVSNTSKTPSSHLLSSFATGLSSSRVSSSIEATGAMLDESDDEDVEYKGHFYSGCSIPPPSAVRGWVRGCWVAGSWT